MEDRARLSAVLRVADSMLAAAMVARVTSACAELASVVDGQNAVHGESQVPPGYVAPAQSDAFCMVCRRILSGHWVVKTAQMHNLLPA